MSGISLHCDHTLFNNVINELTHEVQRLLALTSEQATEIVVLTQERDNQNVWAKEFRDRLERQSVLLGKAKKLIAESRTTFEMWKDVAPAISLCRDLDALLLQLKGK